MAAEGAQKMRTKYETSRLKDAFEVIDEALTDIDTNNGACLCTEDGHMCDNHERLDDLYEALRP